MNILIWHVHGAWTTAFVQGKHRYLLPTNADRDPYGLGRARTYPWPDNAVEISPEELAHAEVDVAVLQRPEEYVLARRWLRREVPAIYVEHNTPKGDVPNTRHPMADRDDLLLVHVTHFNEVFWDAGSTRTAVVEHGIPEPAAKYTGELERIAIATNEPVRRWRVTGTDLMPRFAAVAPLDVYGMGVAGLPRKLRLPGDRLRVYDDPTQSDMHTELAKRRVYAHLTRWTSLGLSLLEAMSIGMPVVALATTEVVAAVPADGGVLDTRVDALVDAAEWLLRDPEAAQRMGTRAQRAVRTRYGVDRFLADWDRLLEMALREAARQ